MPQEPANIHYDLFISCKSEDYEMGKKVSDYLSQFQIKSFLAPEDLREIGISDYGKAIDIALDSSDNMVVVASSADYAYEHDSPYVYYEWHTFAEEKKSGRKRGNIMTIVSNKNVRSQLPIGLRNYQSFMFDDYSDIVGFIRKNTKGPTMNQERSETPSKHIDDDALTTNRSRLAKFLSQNMLSALIVLVVTLVTVSVSIIVSIAIITYIITATSTRSLDLPELPIHKEQIICSPVDLGLPSGTLWGDRNIGAQKESDFGDFYSWGEIVTKKDYSINTYSVETKPRFQITSAEHDAAKAILGDEWSLPTEAQFQELIDSCDWKWTTKNGHLGFEITRNNGNKLFLPAAGWKCSPTIEHRDVYGYYWTSERTPGDNRFARHLLFPKNEKGIVGNGNMYYGRSIRAVYSSRNSHPEAIAE